VGARVVRGCTRAGASAHVPRRTPGLAADALDADPARDRLLARHRLEAAPAAAATPLPVQRTHGNVADLACEGAGAGEDRSVDDHGAADADVAVDQEPVADAAQ